MPVVLRTAFDLFKFSRLLLISLEPLRRYFVSPSLLMKQPNRILGCCSTGENLTRHDCTWHVRSPTASQPAALPARGPLTRGGAHTRAAPCRKALGQSWCAGDHFSSFSLRPRCVGSKLLAIGSGPNVIGSPQEVLGCLGDDPDDTAIGTMPTSLRSSDAPP